MNETRPTNRRAFLGISATAPLIVSAETAFGYQANSAIAIGIIGCGGRGNYVGNFFVEYSGAKVVALADPVKAPLEETARRWQVDSSRLYDGVDGYKKLVESGLDAVLVMSPPFFHPPQVKAAVEAGHHVYLAKPVAVDTAGCLDIMSSGKMLAGKKSFWVDFQTRAQPAFQDLIERVHRGDLGTIGLAQTFYYTSVPNIKSGDGLPPLQQRLREWLGDKVLSGDIIVEQHIHAIDVGNWFFNAHPESATGTCGRRVRTRGTCNDFFLATYRYPNGITSAHSSLQFTKGFNQIGARAFGGDGTADAHYNGSLEITGQHPWKGPEKDDTFKSGAIANSKRFVESIRSGTPINNAETASESTLTAILGRTAAYRGKEVTWSELIKEREQYKFPSA